MITHTEFDYAIIHWKNVLRSFKWIHILKLFKEFTVFSLRDSIGNIQRRLNLHTNQIANKNTSSGNPPNWHKNINTLERSPGRRETVLDTGWHAYILSVTRV